MLKPSNGREEKTVWRRDLGTGIPIHDYGEKEKQNEIDAYGLHIYGRLAYLWAKCWVYVE